MMARCPLLAVALAVTLAGCTAGTGQRDIEPEFIFRYAENQIEDYPTTQAARYFAEAVEERTGGRIQIEVCPLGVLGGGFYAGVAVLAGGGQQFAECAAAALSVS